MISWLSLQYHRKEVFKMACKTTKKKKTGKGTKK